MAQEKKFNNLKSYLFHSTSFSEVSFEVVTINNEVYVGFQRRTYPVQRDKTRGENPICKIIYVPYKAWCKLLKEVVPSATKFIIKTEQELEQEVVEVVQVKQEQQQEEKTKPTNNAKGIFIL